MKLIVIILTTLTLILLGIIYLSYTELSDRNRVLQSEINGLRIENKKEKDSLNQVLKVTKDSLSIAKHTILLAHSERLKAEEKSREERRKFQSIVFVRYESDSARTNALRKLYKTYTP